MVSYCYSVREFPCYIVSDYDGFRMGIEWEKEEPIVRFNLSGGDGTVGLCDAEFMFDDTWEKCPSTLSIPFLRDLIDFHLNKAGMGKNASWVLASMRAVDALERKESDKKEGQLAYSEPKVLVKCMRASAAKATFSTQKMRFTHPWKWNDFNEGFFKTNYHADVTEKPDDFHEKFSRYQQFNKTVKDKISKVRACCFSELVETFYMWAYYGDEGKGVMVFFNFESLKKKYGDKLKRIRYVYEVPVLDAENNDKFDGFYIKYKDWQHEKEWRIVLDEEECLKDSEIGAVKGSSELTIDIPFGPEDIESIIIGPKVTYRKARNIFKSISDEFKKKVRIYLASVQTRDYSKFEANPIYTLNDIKEAYSSRKAKLSTSK